ncbi:helix-turn-helix transcriptional regulator [Limnobacter parvus]|uniref:Helix-turn-helix transcriptional regulator n=1 Tax=Limnobacter parvus TaxID=2939690 RepID=A0ABT1XD59_9BURK|nr:helix-turn-helix transcriptional regulator [Limnobacter parvus]MCR2745200.1 helix-turn-helix transcriptional regulator [Limnobacter parvus]
MITKTDTIQEFSVLKNQLDLAALVRQQRHRAGPKGGKMPAQVLADLAGIGRDTVFRIERGEDVSFSTVMAVLRVFGLGLHATVVPWPKLTEANSYFKAHTE